MRSIYLLPCALLVIVITLIPRANAETPIHAMTMSGVVLEQGNNDLISAFSAWLSRKADYPLSPRFTGSYRELSTYLRDHPGALAWTCGVPYVQDHADDGQQLVAIPLFRGSPTYYSLVITRAGRPEKTLLDFKGKVFAYSDPRSNSGFIAPSYELKQQGIDINQHFRYLMHTGLHENSIEALLAGQADVANIDEYVVVEYFKAHPEAEKQLAILERFGPFPFTPIVAARDVSPETITRMQEALTSIHTDPEGLALLKRLGLDGFVVRPHTFYQRIADMLDTLNSD